MDEDCGDALLCIAGRCRTQCEGYAECAIGSACLFDSAAGLGGCRVDDESACTGAADCPSGTTCTGGLCTASCTSSATCGGTACAAGACEDPDATRTVCDGDAWCGSEVCGGPDCDPILALALGSTLTCTLRDSGAVDCAGSDESGLLGDGAPEPMDRVRATLAPIMEAEPLQFVGAGAEHACAVLFGSEVRCWGAADRGQTGAAGAVAAPATAIPPPTDESASIDEVSIGAYHGCLRRASGAVECWGSDAAGQLGDAMVHPACASGAPCSAAPVVVAGLTDVLDLDAGRDATCAVRESGAVVCWGRADGGLVTGDSTCTLEGGANVSCRQTPAEVAGVANAIAVSVGDGHACAIDVDGEVWCWGASADGQAGAGGATPVRIALPMASSAIATGRAHSCAVTFDRRVHCWGANDAAQRGDVAAGGGATPSEVGGLPRAIDVVSGDDHLCAITTDGEVWCWGRDDRGQLADGMRGTGGEGPPRRARR
jgi:alpha-tubulin suppressor-like RCC1 family protein